MPLSDEEMRLLEQMERALVEEDPKFASTLRGTRFARATKARIAVASTVFVIGVVLLMTGAIASTQVGTTVSIVIGIVGFVLMLGSATIGLAAWRGRQTPSEQAATSGGPEDAPSGLSVLQGGKSSSRKTKKGTGRSTGRGSARKPKTTGTFMQRFEQRWQRRRDQNNGGY